MPRSKRNKEVSLTNTKAKTKDQKTELIASLREYVDEYKHIFVFSYENLKGTKFRDIRFHWRESKLYMGKHSLSQIAFGRKPEDEYKDNLRHVSDILSGEEGILFTNREVQEVIEYFNNFHPTEFAKAGELPTDAFVIPVGPLPSKFNVSMLDQFRKLGMIAEIEDGQLMLREEYVAAKTGVPLTPEQAKVLTHFDKQLSIFKIKLECHWCNGQFEKY